MHPTKNDLPGSTREKVTRLIGRHLAAGIDLYLQAKQAHWNVKGPNFIALHELFDAVATLVSGHVDTMAERITALGGVAEGTVPVVTERSKLRPYPLEIVSGQEHVEALSTALAEFGKGVRAAIDESDELGDVDTADLFTAVSRDVDKQLWLVEAHAQGGEREPGAADGHAGSRAARGARR